MRHIVHLRGHLLPGPVPDCDGWHGGLRRFGLRHQLQLRKLRLFEQPEDLQSARVQFRFGHAGGVRHRRCFHGLEHHSRQSGLAHAFGGVPADGARAPAFVARPGRIDGGDRHAADSAGGGHHLVGATLSVWAYFQTSATAVDAGSGVNVELKTTLGEIDAFPVFTALPANTWVHVSGVVTNSLAASTQGIELQFSDPPGNFKGTLDFDDLSIGP